MIKVSCAIIIKDSKILAVQRGLESSHPWQWEFPGGKINTDETAEQCIIREIKEELNISITIMDQFAPVQFDYGNKQIHLIPFVCKIASGEITLNEHSALQWIELNEWPSVDWSGADRKLIMENKESLKSLFSKDKY